MRVSSALKLALLLLAILAVGLVAAVKSMNLDRAKDLLTRQVHAATGRTLTIAGPLELRLGLVPRVVANGLTLSNPAGSSRPDMVKIERIEAEVSLLPLLKREIRVNRLIVSAPDILVETAAKGRGNLDFNTPGEPTPQQPSTADGAPAYHFTLREVKLKNGVIGWYDRDTRKTETVTLHKLTILPERTPGGMLAVQVVAQALGHMVEISGAVGGPDHDAAKPWPLHLKATTDGLVLTAEGSIVDPLAARGLDLKLTAQGGELGDVLAFAGVQLPLGPYKVATRLTGDGNALALSELDAAVGKRDALLASAKGEIKNLNALTGADLSVTLDSDNLAGLSKLVGADVPSMGPVKVAGLLRGGGHAWKLSEMKATLAESDLTGELALDTQRRTRLSGKLAGNTLVLNDFTTPASRPGEKLPPKPVKANGNDGRIFSAQPLPFAALRQVDIDLALQVAKLITDSLELTDITAELHLKDGRLALRPVRAGMAGGTVDGEATLDASGKTANAVVRLNARQVELGRLPGQNYLSGGKSDMKLDLRAQGDSVRALMASTNGETVLNVGPGRLQNKAVDWAGGDLLFQVLGSLNPLSKSEETTQLSCAVARFTIRDGLATADKGVAVRTAKVDVVGSGTVDLRSEALDMGIRPRARDGVGFSLSGPLAGLTRLRGTLANPVFGIDEEGTARTAASVGAAVATGGLSLLGELLVDKVTADSDPCRTALGQSSAPAKPAKGKKSGGGGLLEGLFGR